MAVGPLSAATAIALAVWAWEDGTGVDGAAEDEEAGLAQPQNARANTNARQINFFIVIFPFIKNDATETKI
jgi:hypothetical protein